MTPRQIKEMLYTAARTDNASMALAAAREFTEQGLWTSGAHWVAVKPDGTEALIFAKHPGTCVLCDRDFAPGQQIRWRSRVDCHVDCWEKNFQIGGTSGRV